MVVLEARDRVGGKTYSPLLDDVAVDLGAHWVGPLHRRVRALAGELGIVPERQLLRGRHVTVFGGRRRAHRFELPVAPVGGLVELGLRTAELEVRRMWMPADAPWQRRGAAGEDARTLGDWAASLRSTTARAAVVALARTAVGVEPDELSLRHVLWLGAQNGGLASIMRFHGGAQDAHLPGGTQQLAAHLATGLDDDLVLGAAVRSIETSGDEVRVHADGVGETPGASGGSGAGGGGTATPGRADVLAPAGGSVVVIARRVAVALPPALSAGIAFSPALPPARAALAAQAPSGAYTKAILRFDRPWWRDEGLSGLALADRGPVQMVVDAGRAGDHPGILAAFVTGAAARTVGRLPPDARRRPVLDAVAALLGPRSGAPDGYADLDWTTEPWSLGGPVAVLPRANAIPRAASSSARMRTAFGPTPWIASRSSAVTSTSCAERTTPRAASSRGATSPILGVSCGVGRTHGACIAPTEHVCPPTTRLIAWPTIRSSTRAR